MIATTEVEGIHFAAVNQRQDIDEEVNNTATVVRFAACEATECCDGLEHHIPKKLLNDQKTVRDVFARLWIDDGLCRLVEDEPLFQANCRAEVDQHVNNPIRGGGDVGFIRDHVNMFCDANLHLMRIDLIAANVPEDLKKVHSSTKTKPGRLLHGMRVTVCTQLQQVEEMDSYVAVRIDTVVSKAINAATCVSDLLYWSSESSVNNDTGVEFTSNVMKTLDHHYWVTLRNSTSAQKVLASETIPLGAGSSCKDINELLKLVNANMNRFSRTWRFRLIAGMLQGMKVNATKLENERYSFELHHASDAWLVRYDNLYDYLLDDSLPVMTREDLVPKAASGSLAKPATTSDVGIAVLRRLYVDHFFSVCLDQPRLIEAAFNELCGHDIQIFVDRGYCKHPLVKAMLIPPRELLMAVSDKTRVSYKVLDSNHPGIVHLVGFMLPPVKVESFVEVGYFDIYFRPAIPGNIISMACLVADVSVKSGVSGKKDKNPFTSDSLPWHSFEADYMVMSRDYYAILRVMLQSFVSNQLMEGFDCALFRGGLVGLTIGRDTDTSTALEWKISAEYLLYSSS